MDTETKPLTPSDPTAKGVDLTPLVRAWRVAPESERCTAMLINSVRLDQDERGDRRCCRRAKIGGMCYQHAAYAAKHKSSYCLEAIEMAFFNHDTNGAEESQDAWENKRTAWQSFKRYLETPREDALSERPNVKAQTPPTTTIDTQNNEH